MAENEVDKSVKLTKQNHDSINKIVRDSKFPELLNYNKAANLAVEKGIPAVRKLYSKPQTK